VPESAYADEGANKNRSGTKIWHFSHVDEGQRRSARSAGADERQSRRWLEGSSAQVKFQTNVSVYTGVVVLRYVFLGPVAF